MAGSLGSIVNLSNLGFGDLVSVDAGDPMPASVHLHHHPMRFCRGLAEDLLENFYDELHRGVVVVVQEDPKQLRFVSLLLLPFEDLASTFTVGVRHALILARTIHEAP